jgi:DNA-binding MarR family transcriptional regulator
MTALSIANCHCLALRRAARRVSDMYDEALAATGVRATQFGILATLGAAGGLSINELADRLDLDRTTTGKNLRPLERDGLIVVSVSGTDRRSRVIALTGAGRRKLGAALPLWTAAQAAFEATNGQRKMRTLRAELGELRIDSKQIRTA